MDAMKAIRGTQRWRIPLNWARFLVALVVGLTGVASMVSEFAPRFNMLDSFLDTWPLDFVTESEVRSLAVVTGFLLIMLSRGLMRGKRQAWELTLGVLALSAFFHAARGGWVLASWGTVLAVVLWGALRPLFRARSDPPSVLRGYAALIIGLVLVFTYTLGGFIALRTQFMPVVRLETAVRSALHTIAWMHVARQIPRTPQARWFVDAIPWLSFSALLFGVAQVLRPVATAFLPDPQEREAVKILVRQWGTNSISYFALGAEKSYYFDRTHQAVLAYRLAGNVAVVAGDPIGPREVLPDLVREFSTFCHQQDWHVVYWQVAQDLLPLYATYGLQAMKIGEDAVIDPLTFTLRGRVMQNVRASVNHAEKSGLDIRFFHGTVDEPEVARQMEALSAAWLAEKGGVEMGFSMGRFGDQPERDTVFAVAVDTEHRVHAFTSFVPIYGRTGWALDLMRRDTGAAGGTMELLLVRAIEHFARLGTQVVSLGLAPLANTTGEHTTNVTQVCSYLTSRFGGLASARSLYDFKRKFQPRWESRYLVYPNTLALPRVGLALVAAHLSRHWLPWVRATERRRAYAAQARSMPRVA